jgi:hypothetical protein
MIAPISSMSQEKANLIAEEYLKGLTVWALHMRHYPVPKAAIIKLLHDRGIMRPSTQSADPTLEEIAERARGIRESWTEEEAMRRWVGRGMASFQSSLVGEE